MVRDVTLHIGKGMALSALRPEKSLRKWCRNRRESAKKKRKNSPRSGRSLKGLMITI